MGRRKSYDRDKLIKSAMDLFRDHGFAGTSADMLVEKLGVNRYSLYAEFGSKQALFDAALHLYGEEVVEPNFGKLDKPEAGIDEVCALLKFYGAASKGPAFGRGCLLCNTAVEFGPEDPSGAGFVQDYFERLTGAFKTALSNANKRGELKPSAKPNEEASFLTASVLGLFVMLRSEAPTTMIKNAAQVAIRHAEDLRA